VVSLVRAGEPVLLQLCRQHAFEDVLEAFGIRAGPAPEGAEAAGVAEDVLDGDALLAAGRELWKVVRHAVAEGERALVHQAADRGRDQGFGRAAEIEHGVGGHRDPWSRVSDRRVEEAVAVP
jgi:hypothetical protein